MLICSGATSLGCDPAIPGMKQVHGAWKACKPHQRLRPPDFASDRENGIRAAVLCAIGPEETQFSQQLFSTKSKESSHPRILKRCNSYAPPRDNRREPARDAGAKSALGIEKKPAPRVTSFSIRVFVGQRNHGLPSSLRPLWRNSFFHSPRVFIPLSSCHCQAA